MKRLVLLFALLLLVAAPAEGQTLPDSAAFVTRLGEDTLSVERWVRTADRFEAEAVIRAPRTSRWHYVADLTPDGLVQRYEARRLDPAEPGAPALATESLTRAGDGWQRSVTADGETQTTEVDAGAELLPFIDLVFWPYELALLRGAGEEERIQPLLSGSRAIPFTVQRTGPATGIFAHPFRGPSAVRIDPTGRLLALDASETTRKVIVERHPWVDVDAAAGRWAAADAEGRGIGELSGRADEEARVGEATLALDYGTPTKRGRTIFGEVVPWGELWRTGANQATHFTTDRPLVFAPGTVDALEVPPGTYTLFSIPQPEGGTLIVNRQTGQNGNSYDAAQDLGRVPLRRVTLTDTVERFTIRPVADGANAGQFRIEWDDTALVVPFSVE